MFESRDGFLNLQLFMITIYHNTECNKSNVALSILEEKGVPFEVRFYLIDKLNREELAALLKKLDMNPSGLLRRSEPLFTGLNSNAPTEADWFELMLEHPVLIERPVVENGDKAIIARPPERVLEII